MRPATDVPTLRFSTTPMSNPIAPSALSAAEAGARQKPARSRWGLTLLAAFSLSLAVPLVALPFVSRSPLWGLLPTAVHQAADPWRELNEQLPGILPAFGLAIVAVWIVGVGIRATMSTLLERGFYGRDLLKPGSQHKMYVTAFSLSSFLGSCEMECISDSAGGVSLVQS